MNKLISIIIPTYNMEEYLPRCLDSLVETKYLDNIEIIVVNDGSKDNSLTIAHQYQAKHPNSFVVIDKENGNYGSTINAALPRVTGKYVKILDSDDWFNTSAFNQFIEKLQTTNCDMIFTPYTRNYVDGNNEVSIITGVQENKTYDFETFMDNVYIPKGMRMHMITYKSEIVTKNNYTQTEGISYTDNEWSFYPLYYVNSIEYANLNLYQHFIGRNEQTTNPKVRAKNYWQELVVTTKMLKTFGNYNPNTPQYKTLSKMIIDRIPANYTFIMKNRYSKINFDYLKKLKDALELHPHLKAIAETHTIGGPLKLHAVRHWNRTGKTYPPYLLWLLNLGSTLNNVLTKFKK